MVRVKKRLVPGVERLSAVILAGGEGTRLRQVIPDLPKPMAPISGKPFLSYQIAWLAKQGIRRVILSVGYRYDSIVEYFGGSYGGVDLAYAIEREPRGTGGGLLLALDQVDAENVLLLNGDTFFSISVTTLWETHTTNSADVTLSLRRLKDTGRYGRVEVNEHGRVTSFSEKGKGSPGLVNGGVYMISASAFTTNAPSGSFSFEKDFLEKVVTELLLVGVPFDGFFIDIGTPKDYERAQTLLPGRSNRGHEA